MFVYARTPSGWSFHAKVQSNPPQSNAQFGVSFALGLDRMVVGALAENNEAGAVYVFERTQGQWVQTARLTASDPGPGRLFGYCVDLDGDRLVAGSPAGAAYVFEKSPSGWVQVQRVTGLDSHSFNDRYGQAVALEGNTLVVGAYLREDFGFRAGCVYVFKLITGTWQQQAKLYASDAGPFQEFGNQVGLANGTLVIAAPYFEDPQAGGGTLYVFREVAGNWIQEARLVPSDLSLGDRFGYASTNGQQIVAAGRYSSALGPESGSAYLFEHISGQWVERGKIVATGGASGDHFGSGLSLNGSTMVIGANLSDLSGANSGAAYVYDLSTPGCWENCGGTSWFDGLEIEANPSLDLDSNGILDSCQVDRSLDLHGAAWVRVPDSAALDLTGTLTLEAWVRPDAATGAILDKWGDAGLNDRSYSLEYRPGGVIQFGLARDDNQLDSSFHNFTSGAVPPATWHHVACVYDGASRRTYVDGLLVGERPTTGLVHVGSTDLSIGAHLRSNTGPVIDPFDGRIDEVRIWSTARTQTQIRQWINETIDPPDVASHPGLVAAWNFDGNTADSTGVHDGVAVGAVSYALSSDIPFLFDCDGNTVNDLQEISANASLDLNGNAVLDSCECLASTYCIGAPNSVGAGARIGYAGTVSVGLNNLTLLCTGLPPSTSGLFFYGLTQVQVPFGNGFRCAGGSIHRAGVVQASPTGNASKALNYAALPPAGAVHPGSLWNFQFWYRNIAGGGAGFNLSEGLSIAFCP